jgi:hypothetical protein
MSVREQPGAATRLINTAGADFDRVVALARVSHPFCGSSDCSHPIAMPCALPQARALHGLSVEVVMAVVPVLLNGSPVRGWRWGLTVGRDVLNSQPPVRAAQPHWTHRWNIT